MDSAEYDDRVDVLFVPFVCVKSCGGPFDDRSFVAGFQLGDVRRALQIAGTIATTALIYSDGVPQADLIAMSAGFTMQVLETLEDGWTHVGFTKSNDVAIPTTEDER